MANSTAEWHSIAPLWESDWFAMTIRLNFWKVDALFAIANGWSCCAYSKRCGHFFSK